MKFEEELNQTGGLSRWLILIVVLSSTPTLCNVFLNMPFMKISSLDFKTRCRIELLENKNWTFEQIQRIAAPLDTKIWNCTYFEYDYNELAEMSYEQALTYLKDAKISYCNEFVHEGCAVYSLYEEFNLVCKKAGLVDDLNIAPVYGAVFASLIFLPLADLFGRKRVMKWGRNLIIASAGMTALANSTDVLLLCRFFTGFAYVLLIRPIEALVVEISNLELRAPCFILLHIPIGFGFIFAPIIATKIWYWRLLQWAACGGLLILPLTTWFLPESPRWFSAKGERFKAWEVLENIQDPVLENDLWHSYQNKKGPDWEEIKTHVYESAPFFTQLLFLTTLSFIANAIYFKAFIERFQMAFYKSRVNYFILSGIEEIISYALCYPLTSFFKRKTTMGWLFLCSGFAYIISSTTMNLFAILTMELTTSAVNLIFLLYLYEIVPTSHRCTFVGFVYAFGGGFATIVMFHMYKYFAGEEHLFIFLSCLCFIGVSVVWFADETQDLSATVEEAIIKLHEDE